MHLSRWPASELKAWFRSLLLESCVYGAPLKRNRCPFSAGLQVPQGVFEELLLQVRQVGRYAAPRAPVAERRRTERLAEGRHKMAAGLEAQLIADLFDRQTPVFD